MKRMLDYVEAHITEDLSLSKVAKELHFSPYYCSVMFHRYFGETMKSYVQRRRILCATKELEGTNNRIIDIAMKYGYSSQESFSRAFSRTIGMSPKRFRDKPLPFAVYEKYKPMEEEVGVKNETITNIHRHLEKEYPLKTLHILNGLCMLESFQQHHLMSETATYLPFNEAMCWGEVSEVIFSPEFIQARTDSLKSTEAEYKKIVMEPLKPLFEEQFGIIVLWFGDDMFCQMNLITILAYLEQIQFEGDVFFCMVREQTDSMLPDAVEMKIEGYNDIYNTIICQQKAYNGALLPVTYQAMNLYLSYQEEKSEIIRYIKKNLHKENLVRELLTLFPQYGLGDLQYEWMIEAIETEEKRKVL